MYSILARFGMQAYLIIAEGPHMKAIVESDAAGRCAMHISAEIKPCKKQTRCSRRERGGGGEG